MFGLPNLLMRIVIALTAVVKLHLWYKGEDVLRVTARKDIYGEVEEFICNTCRFDKKKTADWVIEHPTHIP